jgi:hypothetical protein
LGGHGYLTGYCPPAPFSDNLYDKC